MDLAREHGIALVGGDTTAGPLSVVRAGAGHGAARAGAACAVARVPGDLLFVSGTPGDAAAGLQLEMHGGARDAGSLQARLARDCAARFLFPTPRVALGWRCAVLPAPASMFPMAWRRDALKLAQPAVAALPSRRSGRRCRSAARDAGSRSRIARGAAPVATTTSCASPCRPRGWPSFPNALTNVKCRRDLHRHHRSGSAGLARERTVSPRVSPARLRPFRDAEQGAASQSLPSREAIYPARTPLPGNSCPWQPASQSTNARRLRCRRRIGKYVIVREVGRGSTGNVYLSHDPYYGRDVAIKVYTARRR